jgi:ABC-type phosphate transport system permease subunit
MTTKNKKLTAHEAHDQIRQENIAWGGAFVLVILLLGILSYAY